MASAEPPVLCCSTGETRPVRLLFLRLILTPGILGSHRLHTMALLTPMLRDARECRLRCGVEAGGHGVDRARADRRPASGQQGEGGAARGCAACLSCNQMCWGRRYRDYWISCLINPSAGREFEWGGDRFTPAPKPKHVLVVGGGVAGLEAARVAAERGTA